MVATSANGCNGTAERPPRPEALPVLPDAIPQELRARPQWIVWRHTWRARESKYAKVPFALDGEPAKSNDPATWETFADALAAYRGGDWSGIGYMFAPDDGYCGIDLDHYRDPESGEFQPWARQALEDLDSYSEVSPSQTGAKVIIRGCRPDGITNREGHLAVYHIGRYFALTGHRLDFTSPRIEDSQGQLVEICRRELPSKEKKTSPRCDPSPRSDSGAQPSTNGKPDKFTLLMTGQWQGLGYPSQSEADLALCSMLADMAINRPHPEQTIDLLFRRSGMYRDKWDRLDYRTDTIGKAMEGRHSTSAGRRPVEKFSLGELLAQYPRLDPPIIDGLLRERETANIISTTKVGKSWLAYGLAYSIATGRPWLDRLATSRGRVLLIDNELRKPTIAYRQRTVTDALGIPLADVVNDVEIWALRGNLYDIFEIAADLGEIQPGTFKAVILDAKYCMIPPRASENDNAAETAFYNQLDYYAERIGAAFIGIHHSSKGSQGEKRVTDVGAGAGAQSRAADCHLILREHEEEDIVVLEAAVRSFKPVEPLPLRWVFPLWMPADDIDPSKLRGRMTQQEQWLAERDQEGVDLIIGALTARAPLTVRELRDTGIGPERLTRLLGILERQSKVSWSPAVRSGNGTREFGLSS